MFYNYKGVYQIMLAHILFLSLGLVMLFLGGDWLVRGASRLSLRLGISVMVVGLTVVAFATSAPEFIVSLMASIKGQGNVALGNIIGSNIANIALILGISAILKPIEIKASMMRREIPWMIGATVLFLIPSYFCRSINWVWGIVFLILFGFFLFSCFKRKQEFSVFDSDERESSMVKDVFFLTAGLALLILGGEIAVRNAVRIAISLNISQLFIGITVIALGTSLPELVTSIMASLKNEQDMAVGNVVGSNIFNILWVLGFCSLFHTFTLESSVLAFHLPVMIVISLLCIPIMRTGYTISRKEGFFLLGVYFTYIVILYKYFLR